MPTRFGRCSSLRADFVPHGSDGLIDQRLELGSRQIRVALFYLGRRLRQYFLLNSAFNELREIALFHSMLPKVRAQRAVGLRGYLNGPTNRIVHGRLLST